MKFLIMFGVLLLALARLVGAADKDPGLAEKIQVILSDVKAMAVLGAQGDHVHEAIGALNHLGPGPTRVFVDDHLRGVLTGMAFEFGDGDNFGLAFGRDFIDSYWSGSTVHLSVLVHELWHLRDYLSNQARFRAGKKDAEEDLLYEMDAIHVEAEFIKTYLRDRGPLSKFEQFVSTSFDSDYLASAILLMKIESQDVVLRFTKMSEEIDQSQKPETEFMNEIDGICQQALSNYAAVPADNEFGRFIAFVDLHSVRREIQRIIPGILKKPEMTWDQVFAKYPSLGQDYNKIVQIEQQDWDRRMEYRTGVVSYWEDDIKQLRKVGS